MWRTVKLGDIAEVKAGNSAPQDKTLFEGGTYPFVRTSDVGKIKIGTISDSNDKLNEKGIGKLKLFRKGTILFPKSGASTFLNYRVMLDVDAYVSSHLATIKSKHEEVSDEYLWYHLQTIDAAKLVADSAYPSLNTKTIQEISVALPPLAEQQRIVAKLDAAFAEIDRAIEIGTEKQKQVTALYNLRITQSLANLMHERKHIKLSDLCDRITVGYVGKMSNQYTEEGVPFLRSQSIRPYRISSEGLLHISEEFDESIAKSRLETNDVCVVRTGYPGTAAVVTEEWNGANCSDLVIFTPSSKLNPYFLELFFNSDYGKTLVMGKVVGAAQKHFNVTSAKEVDFPVADLEEQQCIVTTAERLRSGWENAVSAISRKKEQLACLKSSILAQELHLPQSEAA